MNKIYFIDSENVGEGWINLLSDVSDNDTLLVFYTSKSPHMSYDSVIAIKESDRSIQFIECFCGNNALDFQLSTELGNCIHSTNDCMFIIVSNDTGYDVVVKYWQKRKINVSRIKCNNCKLPNDNGKVTDTASVSNTLPSSENSVQTTESNTNTLPVVDDNSKEILYIMGRENLQNLHEALQQLYGTKQGQALYNAFKAKTAYSEFLSKHQKLSLSDKQKQYCSIVFAISAPGETMPNDFPSFVISSWKKKANLNSFKASLQQRYGKEKSEKYYSLFKIHIKLLSQIK